MSRSLPYFKQLDALRCISVFIVIFHHLPLFEESNYFTYFFKNFTGVDTFFILSGFLITGILLNTKEKKTPIKSALKTFYIRRFFRIFPIYYLSIAFLVLVNPSDYSSYAINDILYISNFKMGFDGDFSGITPHFWSLSVEEQFYLFWPLLILLVPFKNQRLLKAILLVFILGIAGQFILKALDYRLLGRLTIGAFAYLSSGAFLSYAFHHKTGIFKSIVNLWPYTFAVILLVPIQYMFGLDASPEFTTLLYLFVGVVIVAKFVDGFKFSIIKSIFENNVVVYFGKISYGLYLYHFIVIHMLSGMNKFLHTSFPLAGTEGAFAKLIMTIVVASLSWVMIEKPLIKLKNKFSY